MNVTCLHCKTKLNIPDHKLPRDKDAAFKCPKCGEKIHVQAANQQTPAGETPAPFFQLSAEDRADALVCIGADADQKKALDVIGRMGFHTEAVIDTRAALNKMEYHIYHLVIVDDAFDRNSGISGIIDRMNAMDMSLRRRICLVWISSRFNTGDHMAALHTSVNAIIHMDDLRHLQGFLSRALTDHKNVYTVYTASLKQMGRA
jgi:predicted Zn finger-like uncharacterized protein